ncbi:MAG: MarR family winged helix-turn-helix transcriptional regulator [Cellvibrionaceae bacterium]
MKNEAFTLIERLANLLRHEARNAGQTLDLQPVQHDALYYLSICNRYSDTPLAVAEFLGLTKGTVSQTLKVLEGRRLISKEKDTNDKRIVHLSLTAAGEQYIENALPPVNFLDALETVTAKKQDDLVKQLKHLLNAYQTTSGRTGFGVCQQCQHNQSQDGQFICGLTNDPLSIEDTALICREFATA